MTALSVEGVIELSVSEQGSNCICCPGNHVYGMGVEITGYEFAWQYRKFPATPSDVVHDAISTFWREHHYSLDGRRVRISVELLPEDE